MYQFSVTKYNNFVQVQQQKLLEGIRNCSEIFLFAEYKN